MLQVMNVGYSYQAGVPILQNVSLTVKEGDILCLLGPNGTGKTTLLRCLLGLRKPMRGQIMIGGKSIYAMTPKQRAALLAYVPQTTSLAFPYQAREVVLMGRVSKLGTSAPRRQDKMAVQEAMERLGIWWLAKKKFQELSGGERQMVLVARALAQQSKLLVMDEPTANLDYGNQIRILRMVDALSAQGYAILMTSHFPDHAFWVCNRVALLRDGVIWHDGAPDDVITSDHLTGLYGTPVYVAQAVINDRGDTAKASIPLMREQEGAHISTAESKGGTPA